jgi:hypothetical protein
VTGLLLLAGYVLIIAPQATFSLLDYPNHLARAVVMSDLLFHHGARFGELFQFRFSPITYILGDLAFATAVYGLGQAIGSAVWLAVVILSLPCALLFYLRNQPLDDATRLLVFCLGLYLATDRFFFMGFLSFRLAVAMTIVALSLTQTLRQHWSGRLYAGYCLLLALGYLIHLSVLVFIAVALTTSALLRLPTRTTSLRRELLLWLPVLVVGAWHAIVSRHALGASDIVLSASNSWRDWLVKYRGLRWSLQWDVLRHPESHFDRRVDRALLLACLVCALLPAAGQLRLRALRNLELLELLLLAAAFLGLYLVLPVGEYVDVRFLSLVPLLLILACANLAAGNGAARAPITRMACALGVLLALGNLAIVTQHLRQDRMWMSQYQDAVTAIARRSTVLPVWPGNDELQLYHHAASSAVTEREALIPYLFSGNQGVYPQTYFRYVTLPYAPNEHWPYDQEPQERAVDWARVACNYDYILVAKPFDFGLIGVPTTPAFENAVAALLKVDRGACARP